MSTEFSFADPLFRQAVEAIDAGDEKLLTDLITEHPYLVGEPLDLPVEGYFRDPYLLWFVAENPIRHDRLPPNIVRITDILIRRARQEGVKNFQDQLDYTLSLVCSGRVSRECGVQIPLIDLLMDAGASGDGALGAAIPHHETAAAAHLLERGAILTLAAAIALERSDDIRRLAGGAGPAERQIGLATAAFYAQPETLSLLLGLGVDMNAYNPGGYHAHSTALHQAVWSGSLDAVKVLVEAGADLHVRDHLFEGTPMDWALYGERESKAGNPDPAMEIKYRAIAAYLALSGPATS